MPIAERSSNQLSAPPTPDAVGPPSRKRGGPFLAHGLTLRGDPSVKPITSRRAARCRSSEWIGLAKRLPDRGIACGRSNDKKCRRNLENNRSRDDRMRRLLCVQEQPTVACAQPEACVQMPERMARSDPRPPFGLPEMPVASGTSRLSCGKPRESRVFTPIRESSGKSRLHKPARET